MYWVSDSWSQQHCKKKKIVLFLWGMICTGTFYFLNNYQVSLSCSLFCLQFSCQFLFRKVVCRYSDTPRTVILYLFTTVLQVSKHISSSVDLLALPSIQCPSYYPSKVWSYTLKAIEDHCNKSVLTRRMLVWCEISSGVPLLVNV